MHKRKVTSRAQGAVEYLLILGAAILVVSLVVVATTGVLGSAKGGATTTQCADDASLHNLRLKNGLFPQLSCSSQEVLTQFPTAYSHGGGPQAGYYVVSTDGGTFISQDTNYATKALCTISYHYGGPSFGTDTRKVGYVYDACKKKWTAYTIFEPNWNTWYSW